MISGSDKQEVASTLDALVRQKIQRIRNKSHENSWASTSVKILEVKLFRACDAILFSLKNELLHLSKPIMKT